MKVEVEMKTTESILCVDVHIDGEQFSPHMASRKLTGTTNETSYGVFSEGIVEYNRRDYAKKLFSQPEPLETCTPEMLKTRIQAVRAWVYEKDGTKTISFEV